MRIEGKFVVESWCTGPFVFASRLPTYLAMRLTQFSRTHHLALPKAPWHDGVSWLMDHLS